MLRRTAIATAALAAMSIFATAGENADKPAVSVQLTAAQIKELLAGNTAFGTWSGSSYTQYYGENGLTVYIPEGGSPDEGKWRVNADTNEYESWWRSTGWTPYTIVITNDGYAYVNGEKLEPFDVFEGKHASR